MKSKVLLLASLSVMGASQLKAQLNVGATGTPDASAILQLSSTTKGLRLPNVALSTTTTFTLTTATSAAAAVGMTVYNTTAGITSSNAAYPATGVGAYTWDGTGWLASKSASANNIYTNDGTLTGPRTVALGANALNFTSTGGGINQLSNFNGYSGMQTKNSNASASAGSQFIVANDGASGMVLFLNSSSNTLDGGTNNGTLRNDAGNLHLYSKGSKGVSITGSTGAMNLTAYGTGINAGTLAYTLGVDATGNVIEQGAAGVNNIYNNDGSLTGTRTVSLGANALNFTSTGGILSIAGNANGITTFRSGNSSAGVSAISQFLLANDGAQGMPLFLNSSTNSSEGGINSGTLRNDAGDLRIQSKGAVGLTLKATTGALQLTAYGAGTNTGTSTYTLGVDATGNVIEQGAAGVNNIYNNDGTLTGARTVSLGANALNFTSTGGGLNQLSNFNGYSTMLTKNSNASTSAGSQFVVANDGASGMVLFLNSSANPSDGGVNNGTLRNDAGNLRLLSKGSQGISIAATSGNIGIGTNSANAPLQFGNSLTNRKIVLYESINNDNQIFGFGVQTGVLRYQVPSTGESHVFYAGTSATASTELMRIGGNSVVTVTGNLTATGTVTQGSDRRLKRNIVGLHSALGQVMQLLPYSYEKKTSIASTNYNIKEMGFIAQDIRKIFPELVVEGSDVDKTLSINYTALIPLLTKAIQEQQVQNDAQLAQIADLKKENVAILVQNATITAQLAEVKEMKTAMAEMRKELNKMAVVKIAGSNTASK